MCTAYYHTIRRDTKKGMLPCNPLAMSVEKMLFSLESSGFYTYFFELVRSKQWLSTPCAFKIPVSFGNPPREVIKWLKNLLTVPKRLIFSTKRRLTPFQRSALLLHPTRAQRDRKWWLFSTLKYLESDPRGLKRDQLIKSDAKLSHMRGIPTSIDGLGSPIATALILATKGCKEVGNGRWLLHRSSLSALQDSPAVITYYERKIREGKPTIYNIAPFFNLLFLRSPYKSLDKKLGICLL